MKAIVLWLLFCAKCHKTMDKWSVREFMNNVDFCSYYQKCGFIISIATQWGSYIEVLKSRNCKKICINNFWGLMKNQSNIFQLVIKRYFIGNKHKYFHPSSHSWYSSNQWPDLLLIHVPATYTTTVYNEVLCLFCDPSRSLNKSEW